MHDHKKGNDVRKRSVCDVNINSESWSVGCFGLNCPLRLYSVFIESSQREREKEERKFDERKNVQTTSTRTFYKRSRALLLDYYNPPALEIYPAQSNHPTVSSKVKETVNNK